MSEQRLLGLRGSNHPHASLWAPGATEHLYPCIDVRRLDQEGHGDGIAGWNHSPCITVYSV